MRYVFNLDFFDLFFAFDNQPLNNASRGFYEKEKLEELIRKAVDSGFEIINFRVAVCGKVFHRSRVKESAVAPPEVARTIEMYDPLEVAIAAARKAGAKCYVWTTPFDDYGVSADRVGPDGPGTKQQSEFSRRHPEFQLLSRDGKDRIWGEYCFGHAEVKNYWLSYVKELLEYNPDGIFFSDRTHSNIALKQREYGFNQPTIERYRDLYGADPREKDCYDLAKFSGVLGDFYTDFLTLAAKEIHAAGKKLMAKVSWRRDGLTAARLGMLDKCFFQWEKWLTSGVVDELIIGGDSATGTNPEHCLAYYETQADSCNPEYFRKVKPDAVLYRWLTLFSWDWANRAQMTADRSTFTAETINTMLDKLKNTSLDGVICHEAMNIDGHDLWRCFAKR